MPKSPGPQESHDTNKKWQELKIVSFNCRGVKKKTEFLNKLSRSADVIFLQETWLRAEEQVEVDEEVLHEFDIHTILAMDSCSNGAKGRPQGGLAWLCRRWMEAKIRNHGKRISICKAGRLTIIGVYLPANGPRDAIIQHRLCIQELETIIDRERTEEEPLIVIGDFNSDPTRDGPFDRILTGTIQRLNARFACAKYKRYNKYTFYGPNGCSNIDHVITLEGREPEVRKVQLIDGIENSSDHLAIEATIRYKQEANTTHSANAPANQQQEIIKPTRKLQWHSPEFVQEYQRMLEINLQAIWTNYKLKRERMNQQERVDVLMEELNSCLLDTAGLVSQIIGRSRASSHQKKVKSKRWWSKEIREIYTRMKYFRRIFMLSSKRNLTARADYQREKKSLNYLKKKNEHEIHLQRAQELAEKYRRDRRGFWKEINAKRTRKATCDLSIDYLYEQMKKWFKKEFANLKSPDKLQSYTDANDEYERSEMNASNTEESTSSRFQIDRDSLSKILCGLKSRKATGHYGISNEHFKFGSSEVMKNVLAELFETIMNFAVFPKSFNHMIIIPVLKKQESRNDISNVRPIAVSNSVANIFERICLDKMNEAYSDIREQFGFKRNSSCNHAVFVARETILECSKKNRKVYIAAIDASKAFDRMTREGMFAECAFIRTNTVLFIHLA